MKKIINEFSIDKYINKSVKQFPFMAKLEPRISFRKKIFKSMCFCIYSPFPRGMLSFSAFLKGV